MGAAITIKGTRYGLLVTLGAGEWGVLLAELGKLFESRNTFFRGGKVALQVGERELSLRKLSRLRQVLAQSDVQVWAVVGTNPSTRVVVEKLGLETVLPVDAPPRVAEQAIDQDLLVGTGILVQRTLRSGQSVSYEGHVVVVGDVNSGAEIVAGGDIIVWGHLRGFVHAGASGDEGRYVCALDLSPIQLRIGGHIARPPEDKRRRRENRPERAFVSDGRIVAERWA